MSVLRNNIISNIFAKGISAILSLIFVPYYIRLLGAEAYGLIGIFATLQTVFMIADMGLSGAFVRETSRLSILDKDPRKTCDLGRTIEYIFLFLGVTIALTISASSSLLAEKWLNAEGLSISTISSCIILIGILIGIQFPLFAYHGGLQGIQRQNILNILIVSAGILKGLGVIIILVYVDKSIESYFIWNIIISALQVVGARSLMWANFAKARIKPKLDFNLIRPLLRFAAGTAGITFSGILLTQVDKILLAKMLPLEKFGYYTLAWVVAGIPGMLATPVNNAVYPRLAQLVATKNISELIKLYHQSCQLIATLCIPTGLVLAFYSKELMLLWTGNITTAENTCHLLSALACGSTLMVLMIIPYSLQLAFGWTELGLKFNILSAIILVPSLFWLVKNFSALGACFVWVAIYLGQTIIMINVMHRRILKEEKNRWYVHDVIAPLAPPLVIISTSTLIIDLSMELLTLTISIIVVFLISVISSILSASSTRNIIFNIIRK